MGMRAKLDSRVWRDLNRKWSRWPIGCWKILFRLFHPSTAVLRDFIILLIKTTCWLKANLLWLTTIESIDAWNRQSFYRHYHYLHMLTLFNSAHRMITEENKKMKVEMKWKSFRKFILRPKSEGWIWFFWLVTQNVFLFAFVKMCFSCEKQNVVSFAMVRETLASCLIIIAQLIDCFWGNSNCALLTLHFVFGLAYMR